MGNLKIFFILLATASILMFQNCSEVAFEELQQSSSLEAFADLGDGTCVSDCGDGGGFDPENPNLDIFPYTGSEWASIAFEDNITNANGGDLDYNDAVVNFKISEEYNSKGELVRIHMHLKKRIKISGNDHRLHIFLNGNPGPHFDNISVLSNKAFVGGADVKVIYEDDSVVQFSENDKITLINSTDRISKNSIIKLQATLKSPELNTKAQRSKVDFTKYRFVLQNKQSSQGRTGIDISEINTSDEMLTPNGHPFGFMIPTDWSAPGEGVLIDKKYPNFMLYRQWLLNGARPSELTTDIMFWFL